MITVARKLSWQDLQPGLSASFDITLTAQMLDDFAERSGDFSPIHVSHEAAVASGFPGRVAHGLLTSSFYSTLVGMYLPGEHALLQAIDVRFLQPAFATDKLQVAGEITGLSEAVRAVRMKASISRGDTVISTADIRAGVRA